jgi:hypothetical protein
MKLTLTIAFIFCSLFAFAQPANDTPCNAEVIEIDGPFAEGNNSDATADALEVVPQETTIATSCYTSWCNDDVAVQNSMWYMFTAPENGAVVISTCNEGSTVDSQIALWQASDCGDYSTYIGLAANDDIEGGCSGGGIYSSAISIDGLVPGSSYYIQVDGWDGESGPFVLSVQSGQPNSLVNFIHTSADPALAMVDVRLDGAMLLDDFSFLACSQFIPIDASGTHTLSIHAPTSTDGDPALLSLEITLNSTLNYEVAITGLLTETGFSSFQPLQMLLFEGAQQYSSTAGAIPLHFLHASTDAPVVDFQNIESGETLADNMLYGNFNSEGYQLFGENFSLSIADESGTPLGLTYCIPAAFAAGSGSAFTIAAIGFVDSANNNNGSPLALYLVNWTDGTLIPLQQGACLFPDNDILCTATLLIVNDAPTEADNSFATIEENESSPTNLPSDDSESDCLNAWCDGTLDNTLWFSFEAPGSGCVMISTCVGDGIDTQIALCTADDCTDPTSVNYLAANDDMANPCSGNIYSSEITYCDLMPGMTYYIQADGYGGELGTFFIQVTESSGISDHAFANAVVCPNPVYDLLYLQGVEAGTTIEILNAMGQIICKEKYAASGMDTRSLQPGAYLIRVEGNFVTTRFIKS